MKIGDISGNNVKVQSAALSALKLRPFGGGRSITARGCVVNPVGGGWAWICAFGGKPEALLQDLCDLEAAEAALPKRRRA
jgi:hypothetical protein